MEKIQVGTSSIRYTQHKRRVLNRLIILITQLLPSTTTQSDGTGSESGGSLDRGPRTQTSDPSITSGIDEKLGASLTDMNAVRLDIIDEKLSTRSRAANSSNYSKIIENIIDLKPETT